jgi:hypothetical protein
MCQFDNLIMFFEGGKKERSKVGKNDGIKKQAYGLLGILKEHFFFYPPLLLLFFTPLFHPPYLTVRFFEATSINALTEGSDTSKKVLG